MNFFICRLNLAVNNALKNDVIEHAIGDCRRIVTHFNHSPKKKHLLTLAQAQLGLPTHSLIADCRTRFVTKLFTIYPTVLKTGLYHFSSYVMFHHCIVAGARSTI